MYVLMDVDGILSSELRFLLRRGPMSTGAVASRRRKCTGGTRRLRSLSSRAIVASGRHRSRFLPGRANPRAGYGSAYKPAITVLTEIVATDSRLARSIYIGKRGGDAYGRFYEKGKKEFSGAAYNLLRRLCGAIESIAVTDASLNDGGRDQPCHLVSGRAGTAN
jgi:hypothetical protein